MTTNYSGDPGNVTTPLSEGITACGSGSGGYVLVTTSTAHEFSTNDFVSIDSVGGTTEANGVNQITVVSSTTFLLNGVPFVNPYTSGGTAEDLSLTPAFENPDDGEPATVQSILTGVQAIADRTQFIWASLLGLLGDGMITVDEFLVTGTWTRPEGVGVALLYMYGAGGGSGGGGGGSTSNDEYSGGGGGGGGAREIWRVLTNLSDPSYTVTIPAGGTAGSAGSGGAGGNGGAGGTASFGTIAYAYGGGGGAGGVGAVANSYAWAKGGKSVAGQATGRFTLDTTTFPSAATALAMFYPPEPGSGGDGVNNKLNAGSPAGGFHPAGHDGGYGGGPGTDGGGGGAQKRGGGGGGGGGAGPGGDGGNGPTGGNGNNGGAGTVGGTGNAPGANSGAGASGGAGGGCGTSAGAGGPGAVGGSGYAAVIWIGRR